MPLDFQVKKQPFNPLKLLSRFSELNFSAKKSILGYDALSYQALMEIYYDVEI